MKTLHFSRTLDKKGLLLLFIKCVDYQNVQNYRGITLGSCLSKPFTTILNNSITQVCYRHTIITDAKFGFRKGKSIVDGIFVLMSVIQKYIFEKKRLCVVFVDLMK